MRIGIIADIHSNAQALISVFSRMGAVDQVWCLGDVVGYGPEPKLCIDLVRSHSCRCVVGNHDLCVLGEIDVSDFSLDAIKACEWNRNRLNESYLDYLRFLPLEIEPIPGILLVHGSPGVNKWEYILSSWQADEILSNTAFQVIFVGHSHIPLMFMKEGNGPVEFMPLTSGQTIKLEKERIKYLINPGSVGQPRDGDNRASFMILNTGDYTLEFYRVEYPIDIVREEMLLEGLPASLADRLESGT